MSSSEIAATYTPFRMKRDFEEAIFQHSPFSWPVTAALIFVFLMACFCGAMTLEHDALLAPHGQPFGLGGGVWPAVVLSLLIAVSLGMQRFSRLREKMDVESYAAIFSRSNAERGVSSNARIENRIRAATISGVLIGIAMSFSLTPLGFLQSHPIVFAWFFVVETFVVVLFARGIAKSSRAAALFAQLIDADLKIDLLRVDLLTIIGRNSARSALIWFSVAAVICLFFVGNDMGTSVLATLLVSAGMGIWIFLRPMERVHRRIRAAKLAELETIRKAIAKARLQAPTDASAAMRLQGLLAYETRIEAVREWPFDQSTGMRLAAYLLIPAVPWFGQAIAGYFVEHLAR